MRHATVAVLIAFVFGLAGCSPQPAPTSGAAPASAPAPAASAPQANPASTTAPPQTTAAAAPPTTEAPAQTPPVDPKPLEEKPVDANALVQKLSDFYREKKSLQFDCHQRISMDIGGQKNDMQIKANVIVEKPNRIVYRQVESPFQTEIVCDGEQFWVNLVPLKQYVQLPAPKSFDDFRTNPLMAGMFGQSGPLLELLTSDPQKNLMEGVTKTTYVGREKIDDADAHHLKFEQAQFEWDLWIADGDEPRALRFAVDLSKNFGGNAAELLKNAKMSATQNCTNWQFEVSPPPDAFVFRPPEGAKKIDNFASIAGAMSPGIPGAPPTQSTAPAEVKPPSQPQRAVNVGAVTKQGSTSHMGGNVIVSQTGLGIAYGLSQHLTDKARVSYFVIFKGDFSAEKWTTKFEHTSAGRNGRLRAEYTADINDKTLNISHQFQADRVPETLTIEEKSFQPAKGRVFLVDLTADPPTVEQKKVVIPPQANSKERKEADLVELGQALLASLSEKDGAIRDFAALGLGEATPASASESKPESKP